jgi:hypothetical protein
VINEEDGGNGWIYLRVGNPTRKLLEDVDAREESTSMPANRRFLVINDNRRHSRGGKKKRGLDEDALFVMDFRRVHCKSMQLQQCTVLMLRVWQHRSFGVSSSKIDEMKLEGGVPANVE